MSLSDICFVALQVIKLYFHANPLRFPKVVEKDQRQKKQENEVERSLLRLCWQLLQMEGGLYSCPNCAEDAPCAKCRMFAGVFTGYLRHENSEATHDKAKAQWDGTF